LLNRSTASDQIKRILLDRILSGHYQPGERMSELQIAEEFKTSHTPVREAFRYLEALRVVETETYKGTRVRKITRRELEESSLIRSVLEELGAQLAAPTFKNNTQALEEQAAKFMKAAREKNVSDYSEHDMQFHRIIMAQSDNQLLMEIWESLVLESRFRMTLNQIGKDQLEEFGAAHLPIIPELKKGDGASAGMLLKGLICKFHFLKDES